MAPPIGIFYAFKLLPNANNKLTQFNLNRFNNRLKLEEDYDSTSFVANIKINVIKT